MHLDRFRHWVFPSERVFVCYDVQVSVKKKLKSLKVTSVLHLDRHAWDTHISEFVDQRKAV